MDFLNSLSLCNCVNCIIKPCSDIYFWYVNKAYISVVLRTKKELLVSEYKDRSYVVTRRQRVIDMSLSCRCRVSD